MCGRVGLRVRGVPRLVRVLQGLAGLSTQAMPRPEVRTHPYARDRFSRASNQAVKRRIAASARSSISEIGLGFARTPPRHRPRIHQPPKLPPTLPPPLRGIPTPPTPLNAKSRLTCASKGPGIHPSGRTCHPTAGRARVPQHVLQPHIGTVVRRAHPARRWHVSDAHAAASTNESRPRPSRTRPGCRHVPRAHST